jgi:hypothetical protein
MLLHKLRKSKRGFSTVIAVVLSLVILVVVVANVVLWSYTLNQYDWERAHESLSLSATTRSTWFVVQNEYRINNGSKTGGSFLDTRADDGAYETFRERTSAPRTLDINGTFLIDLSKYPLVDIQGIEILIKFQAADTGDAWYLKAYNWTSNTYGNKGFNSTLGFTPTTTTGWDYYAVSIGSLWAAYVRSDGKTFIRFYDPAADGTTTTTKIDFLAVRVITYTLLSFTNNGPVTAHVVSIWVTNSTIHSRYDVNYFINPGSNASFFDAGISLPKSTCIVKAVTELGNIAVISVG